MSIYYLSYLREYISHIYIPLWMVSLLIRERAGSENNITTKESISESSKKLEKW